MSASDRVDTLIIGGGIAGVTAAETVRRLSPERSVTLVDHEDHPLYSRVLLRDYVAGTIVRDKVYLRTRAWYAAKGIHWLPGTRVVKLEVEEGRAHLSNGDSVAYERALLATGGYPRPWSVPGSDLPGVLRFQTLEDADALVAACRKAKHAIVVGSGFIGMDFLQAFVRAGVDTTLIALEPHYWYPVLDVESAGLIADVLHRSGVHLRFRSEIQRVVGDSWVTGVILRDGAELPADAIGVGIGIAPDLGFVYGAGVMFGNGVHVNEYLETDRPEVLAAGDAAEFLDVSVGVRHRLGNWTNAAGHGRAAGRTLAGIRTRYEAVSAYTVEYLGLPVGFIGDCTPRAGNTTVVRGSRASGAVARFILRSGRLVGATLLNRVADRMPATALIRARTDLSERLAELSDPDVPLGSIMPKP